MTDTVPDKTIKLTIEELMETTFDIGAFAEMEQEHLGAELVTFRVDGDLNTIIDFYAVPKAERLPSVDEQVAAAKKRFTEALHTSGEQFLIDLASLKDEDGKRIGSVYPADLALLHIAAHEAFNSPAGGPLVRDRED